MTDESKPAAGKRKVVFSLSVHANESAGREGGIRYIEDVARWWATEKTRPLYTGDVSFPLDQVMAQTEVWLGDLDARREFEQSLCRVETIVGRRFG